MSDERLDRLHTLSGNLKVCLQLWAMFDQDKTFHLIFHFSPFVGQFFVHFISFLTITCSLGLTYKDKIKTTNVAMKYQLSTNIVRTQIQKNHEYFSASISFGYKIIIQ